MPTPPLPHPPSPIDTCRPCCARSPSAQRAELEPEVRALVADAIDARAADAARQPGRRRARRAHRARRPERPGGTLFGPDDVPPRSRGLPDLGPDRRTGPRPHRADRQHRRPCRTTHRRFDCWRGHRPGRGDGLRGRGPDAVLVHARVRHHRARRPGHRRARSSSEAPARRHVHGASTTCRSFPTPAG